MKSMNSDRKIAVDLVAAREILRRIRMRLALVNELGEYIMAENDILTADLDVLQAIVTDVVGAFAALTAANADLKAQIAAGPPGLTADQAQVIADRFAAIEGQLKAATAPVA